MCRIGQGTYVHSTNAIRRMELTDLCRKMCGIYNRIRYDTIVEFNVDSKAECDQLNLAHETKIKKRQCPVSSVHV